MAGYLHRSEEWKNAYMVDGRPSAGRKLFAEMAEALAYAEKLCNWLNPVERCFGIITKQAIRRGSFASVKDPIEQTYACVAAYHRPAKPFSWTATAESIFLKLERLLSRISGTHYYVG